MIIRKATVMTIIVLSCFLFTPGQKSLPKFNQYPSKVEKARVKAINFKKNPDARTMRTRLTAAMHGGVNFAGHYILTGWGCGTGCTNAAIIEARTGDVIWPDQFANIDARYGEGYSDVQLDFKKNSRLLVIHGRPGSRNENVRDLGAGDYYYEWKNNRLYMLKFVAVPTQ